ncbi:retrovirus-related pol polyprotein from transposon TNT 1-94 [Tanacetum coccineum]
MHDDLEYVKSLEKEVDELESEKADFSNIYDLLLEECVSKDVICSYLHSLSDLNAYAELQCLYLHKVKECECLAQKLSKQTESVNKEVHNNLLKSFSKLEKHSISLELALQQCKEQMKNNSVCKENGSNVFRKEREQYHEIQDLKAQMQDKNIAISELKKLIENCKGKSVETQFNKPSVVRQPNAQRIPKPSVLGKPTPFSNSPEMRSLILNGMPDSLFDINQNVESSKKLWDSLEAKYMAEDASSKKFLVSNFTYYKMIVSRPVMKQYNEHLGILRRFTQHKMNMDEAIQVSCIIDKLPPSWKDFKHTLKHLKEELTLVELGSHLRIKESLKVYNDNKGKRKHHNNTRADPNKKAKPTCWKCGKTGHIKRDCKGVNVGNKANGSGTKGLVDGSSNSLKGIYLTRNSRPMFWKLAVHDVDAQYYIPSALHPVVPAASASIADFPVGKVGVYTSPQSQTQQALAHQEDADVRRYGFWVETQELPVMMARACQEVLSSQSNV